MRPYIVVPDKNKRPIRVSINESLVVGSKIDEIEVWSNGILDEKHFKIYRGPKNHKIVNCFRKGNIYIDGDYLLEKDDTYDLRVNSCRIIIGNPKNPKKSIPIVFKDPEYISDDPEPVSNGFVDRGPVNTEELKRKIDLSGNPSISSDVDTLIKRMAARIPGNINQKSFCEYFVRFMSENFSFDMILLYFNEKKKGEQGFKWKVMASYSSDNSNLYVPPKPLREAFLKHRQPHYFDVDDESIVPSKTIVAKSVRKAAIAPIIYNDNVIGMLYADTKYNTFDREEFYKFCAVISNASTHFAVVKEKGHLQKITSDVSMASYVNVCNKLIKPEERNAFILPGIKLIYSYDGRSFVKICKKEHNRNVNECVILYVDVNTDNVVMKGLMASYIEGLKHGYESGNYSGNFIDDIFFFARSILKQDVSVGCIHFKYYVSENALRLIGGNGDGKSVVVKEDEKAASDDSGGSSRLETMFNLEVLYIDEEIAKIKAAEKEGSATPGNSDFFNSTLSCFGGLNAYYSASEGGEVSLVGNKKRDVSPTIDHRLLKKDSLVIFSTDPIKAKYIQEDNFEEIKKLYSNFFYLKRIK